LLLLDGIEGIQDEIEEENPQQVAITLNFEIGGGELKFYMIALHLWEEARHIFEHERETNRDDFRFLVLRERKQGVDDFLGVLELVLDPFGMPVKEIVLGKPACQDMHGGTNDREGVA
jgi:hypothetical protein